MTLTATTKATSFDPQKYTGIDAYYPDPRHAAVLLENSTVSRHVYRPGTVDSVFFDQAIVLHEETVDYVYSKFTPLNQPYVRGSRVFLEKIVDAVTPEDRKSVV